MSTTVTPDFLARAADQLGWNDTPAGKQKRLEDLALLQEPMAVTKGAIHQPGVLITGVTAFLKPGGAPNMV